MSVVLCFLAPRLFAHRLPALCPAQNPSSAIHHCAIGNRGSLDRRGEGPLLALGLESPSAPVGFHRSTAESTVLSCRRETLQDVSFTVMPGQTVALVREDLATRPEFLDFLSFSADDGSS